MLIIGSHVSFRKDTQLLGSLEEALRYHANTFMFYTGTPQSTLRFPIQDEITLKALKKMKETDIDYRNVIVHAPYIVNLGNPDSEKYKFSCRFLKEELERCEQLGISNLVLHPGSHVGCGVESGIYHIGTALNQLLIDSTSHVTILLETMAGKGTEIGSKLEEIKQIMDYVENKERIGVCLDTCHLNDAGYDLTNFDEFLEQFDSIIGLKYIKCIHVNDSKNKRESHKDRHENIGFGEIGFDTLDKIIYNKKLEHVPKILETPYVEKEFPPYQYEIEMIRNRKFDPKLKEKIVS